MVAGFVALCCLLLGVPSVTAETCKGVSEGLPLPKNLELYDHATADSILASLEGDWTVVSRINWFMAGWKCFTGHFAYNTTTNILMANWRFKPVLLAWAEPVDSLQADFEGKIFTHMLLNSISLPLPGILKPLIKVEKNRPVRLVDIGPPNKEGKPDYVVLFDCGIKFVEGGELFVMEREGYTLTHEKLEELRAYCLKYGIKPAFKELARCKPDDLDAAHHHPLLTPKF